MTHPRNAEFQFAPEATVFIVNVIHVHPGKQEEAFKIIQDVVHYVAQRKEGFLWSNLSKSTDGKTVVNIEAIRDENNVAEFFSDPVFVEKFKMLGCCLEKRISYLQGFRPRAPTQLMR
jgi:quinol monooxygenase YgiN